MKRLSCLILFICLFAIINVNGSVIKGRVADSRGNALAGAGVTIDNSFLGVYTDADGAYSFTGLKDGIYLLRFSFIGYETQVQEVKLMEEAIINITLSAHPIITEEVLVNATRAGEHTPLAYSTVSNELLKKQNTGHDLPYLLSLTPSLCRDIRGR